MSEQGSITLSGLPVNGNTVDANDGQATAISQIATEFNKLVPITKISADQSWTLYTPVWTASVSNPVIGNGSLSGKYVKMGRFSFANIAMTAGSTTTFGSGGWSFTMPFSVSTGTLNTVVGISFYYDTSASQSYFANAVTSSVSKVDPYYQNANGANAAIIANVVSSGSPFTWANGDSLVLSLVLETTS